jgi:hypothetical protein
MHNCSNEVKVEILAFEVELDCEVSEMLSPLAISHFFIDQHFHFVTAAYKYSTVPAT